MNNNATALGPRGPSITSMITQRWKGKISALPYLYVVKCWVRDRFRVKGHKLHDGGHRFTEVRQHRAMVNLFPIVPILTSVQIIPLSLVLEWKDGQMK